MRPPASSDAWRRYRHDAALRARRRTVPARLLGALTALALAGSCTTSPVALTHAGGLAPAPRRAEAAIAPAAVQLPSVAPIAAFSNMSPAPEAPGAAAVPMPLAPGYPGPAARPFSLAGHDAIGRVRAQLCLATAVYYEAASESDDGERAVAQVVLNRVRHPAFPASVCGVVYQGSETPNHCQFSFACDGAMARHRISAAGWSRASRIAAAALGGAVFKPVGLAINYHTLAVAPRWSPLLVPAAVIGAHIFYRLQGPSGVPRAFAQTYARAEPVPGPHMPVLAPVLPPAMALALAGPPLVPAASASTPALPPDLPSAANTDTPPPPITPVDQILPRWRDSGTWIKR